MADMFPIPTPAVKEQPKIGIPTPVATIKPPAAVTSSVAQPVAVDQTIPVQTVDKVEATKGAEIAWSPNQSLQGLDITSQRTTAENQRVYKLQQNQALEALKQQIAATENEIAAEVSAIGQLQGEISSLNGQISQINGQISSMQSQIASAKAAAQEAETRAAAARKVVNVPQALNSIEPMAVAPGGGWIGRDYYDDVNAAMAAAKAWSNYDYNSPKEQLKQALLVRFTNNEKRRAGLSNNSPASEWDAVTKEANAIITERAQAGIQ